MPELDIASLTSALQDDAPCGANLEYDPEFLALEEAGAAKGEQQYGDTIIPAREPDWPVVHERALQLAARTRDLRIAVWLVRSGAHIGGLAAAVAGLQLVQALIDRQWAQVHPQLDASDGDDPTFRLNTLAPLADAAGALADLRGAGLSAARGSLRVRDIELAMGRAEPHPGEAVPSEEGVLTAVQALFAKQPELAATMRAGYEAAQGIAQGVDRHMGGAKGPDFTPLKKLLQRVAETAARAQGQSVAGPADAPALPGHPAAAAVPSGTISSREDVSRALDRACEWIERNEPTNPAPLLIRRAQRLMSKSFIDIIRDLAPDGLSQVERLAGLGSE